MIFNFNNNIIHGLKVPEGVYFSILEGGKNSKLEPEEKEILAKFSSTKRSNQFIRGRIAAKETIAKVLGNNQVVSIGRRDDSSAIFPKSITASISHSERFSIAAACSKNQLSGIGIDMEHISRKVKKTLIKRFYSIQELNFCVKHLKELPESNRLLALFIAKEAAYKAFKELNYNIKTIYSDITIIPKGSVLTVHNKQFKILLSFAKFKEHLMCCAYSQPEFSLGLGELVHIK